MVHHVCYTQLRGLLLLVVLMLLLQRFPYPEDLTPAPKVVSYLVPVLLP
jgi:hypothetical protein